MDKVDKPEHGPNRETLTLKGNINKNDNEGLLVSLLALKIVFRFLFYQTAGNKLFVNYLLFILI